MRLQLPAPRLLPLTIGALAALLSVKTVGVMRLVFAQPAMAASDSKPATPAGAAPAAMPAASAPAAPAPAAPLPAAPVPAAPASAEKPGVMPGVPGTAPSAPTAPAAPAAGLMPIAGAAAKPPEITESERAILLDLRKRREELDARERDYAGREAVIAAAEHRLAQRVTELQALQARLESLEAAREQREEANWRGLVKVYETMKPRDAAAIFNELDMQVLLPVLDRMKETKAAPVLAAMQPDKARQATTGLAQLRLKQTTPPNGS